MKDRKRKERRALRRCFARHYPPAYAQRLLETLMTQCLHYRPASADDIQATELMLFCIRLDRWLNTTL